MSQWIYGILYIRLWLNTMCIDNKWRKWYSLTFHELSWIFTTREINCCIKWKVKNVISTHILEFWQRGMVPITTITGTLHLFFFNESLFSFILNWQITRVEPEAIWKFHSSHDPISHWKIVSNSQLTMA